MRIAALALLLAFATLPVRAQRASDVPGRPAPVALSETSAPLSLGALFNAQTLDFSQSVEMSFGGGYGGTVGLGVYTSTLRWQPSSRLAARVDVSAARAVGSSPFASQEPRVFLRNAEIAYRPTDSATVHFRISQSPYGAYATPYGASPYGLSRANAYDRSFGPGGADALFFRDGQ